MELKSRQHILFGPAYRIESTVNYLLNRGWSILPFTLKLEKARIANSDDSGEKDEIFMCVVLEMIIGINEAPMGFTEENMADVDIEGHKDN
ncbi:MAG TPA: hypothetical protein VEP90_14570 [Methylomirabilota bacterium]|nr:hypothetical protein [Methylomirabilota bacterium]